MKIYLKIPFILVILFAFNFPLKASAHNEVHFTEGDFNTVLKKAKDENKVLMIDFITDWCKWCIETDKKVYTNALVADFANANQVNWKIDAEKGEGVDLAKKYNVKGYPTIIFVNGDGVEIDRIYGYIFAQDFLIRMKDYGAGVNTYASLKQAVETNPGDAAANYKFADKMINNGESEGAEPYLTKTITLDPGNSAGYTDDAKYALAALKNDAAALKTFMSEYPTSDKMKDAYVSLAGALLKEDFNSALGYYNEAFTKYGKTDETLQFNYGMFLLDRGFTTMNNKEAKDEDRIAALSSLQEALQYTGGSVNEPTTYYVIGNLYYQMNDKVKANEAVDKALSLSDKKSYRDLKEKINSTSDQTQK